jgi:dTMP kinase
MLNQSYFITIEGVDGVGKSTLCCSLVNHYKKKGVNTYILRAPGQTELGQHLRELILNSDLITRDMTAFLLYNADLSELVSLIKTLKNNNNPALIICDRYIDSMYAYQGKGKGINLDLIQTLLDEIVRDVKPQLTLYLDLDIEKAQYRKINMGVKLDNIEKLGNDFQERVREGYLEIAAANPNRIVTLDASVSPEVLLNTAINTINSKLNPLLLKDNYLLPNYEELNY